MPVPSLITDLSTTLASNSPSGSDNVFPSLDDYLRALSGFVASIRDNSGNGWVSPYLPLTYSAGTANGVVYLNGSKVVTTGSALVFDGTNFSTTGTASATKLIPTGGSATGNGMFLPAANTLAWSNNGAETMRLDSSGNLGLGVTPSAWVSNRRVMQIGGLAAAGIALNGTGAVSEIFANAFRDSGGTYRYFATAPSSYVDFNNSTSGGWAWSIAPSGTAGNAISFTQAMTLDASGNLGVGITAPQTKAHVSGASTTSLRVTCTGGSGVNLDLTATSTEAQIGSPNGVALLFNTTNTERARITSGGDLLVGTTTSLASYRFQVASGSNSGGVFQTTAAGSFGATAWNTATSGDNLFFGMFTEGTATQRGSIDYNRAGGLVRYNTTSDYRAKDIIGPVQNPGATIDALKVYEGRMKGASQSRPMLIAHEAQAHVPFCVSGEKDEENEDGSPKFQQMDHASLVPLLLAEIQSLRARVAQLESKA